MQHLSCVVNGFVAFLITSNFTISLFIAYIMGRGVLSSNCSQWTLLQRYLANNKVCSPMLDISIVNSRWVTAHGVPQNTEKTWLAQGVSRPSVSTPKQERALVPALGRRTRMGYFCLSAINTGCSSAKKMAGTSLFFFSLYLERTQAVSSSEQLTFEV